MKANRKAGHGAPAAGASDGEEGAIHVLEAVIFAILILASIAFVVTFDVPTTQHQREQADLEVLLADVFEVLSSRASPEAPDVYRDALEQYVMESISGNPTNLTRYLDAVLPPGIEYNMYLDNGYARYPVYVTGTPPRDAVAEARLFVPKLSYTFLEPDVRYQHSEVPMSVWALPVAKGVLLHDEGESIEFWVAGNELDPDTGDKIPFTVRAYHTTAWITNEGETKYPSVSLQLNDTPASPYGSTFRYVPRAKLTEIPGPDGGSYYKFPVELRETAGRPIPAGATLTAHLPRGWYIGDEYLANMEEENAADWTNLRVEGTEFVGWNITAELVHDVAAHGSVFFRHEAIYRFLLDTSANFHLHHEYYLGGGAQGRAEVIVESTSENPIGKLGRRVWPSLSRPSVGGEDAVWGLSFTNAAGEVTVTQAGFRVVSKAEMIDDVRAGHRDLTRNEPAGAGRIATPGAEWVATPYSVTWDPVADLTVATAEVLDLVVPLTFRPSTNQDYRGLDYVRVPVEFRTSWNVTEHTPFWDGWEFTWWENLTRHGGPFTGKDIVFPYDDWPALGFPSEQTVTFRFEANTAWQGAELPGTRTYTISPDDFSSSTFSDYQGAAQQSGINITDAQGNDRREFELGDRVYIRNDFSALFASLGRTESARISDAVDVVTQVFTPAGAYPHIPAQVYRETGAVSSSLEGPIVTLLAVDLDGDGVLDAVAGGKDRNVYALDGNDGSRFWTYTTQGGHQAGFALVDLDSDGITELVTGSRDNFVTALRKDPAVHAADRVMWTVAPTNRNVPSTGHDVNHVAALQLDGDAGPEILVATGENTKRGHVYALDGKTGAEQWNHTVLYDPVSGVDVTFTQVAGGTLDGEPVVFAGSRNDRVYAFDARGRHLYDHAMTVQGAPGPDAGDVIALQVADLNGDGQDDTVVAQPSSGPNGVGRVWAFNGTKATADTHLVLWGGVTAIRDLEVVDEWRQYWVGTPLRLRATTDGWVTSKYAYPDMAQGVPYEAVEFLDRNVGFVVTQSGHVYKTETGGLDGAEGIPNGIPNSWSSFANLSVDLPDPDLAAQQPVTGMAWVNESEGWIISDIGKVYRYVDDGDGATYDWRILLPPICGDPADPPGCQRTVTLEDIDVLPGGDVVIAGTYRELAPSSEEGGVIFRWDAAARAWHRPHLEADKLLFGVDMLDADEGWTVGAAGLVMHTTDGWQTYETQTLNDGFEDFLYDVEMVSPTHGFIAGKDDRMYRLVDGGDQWTALGSELEADVNMVTVAALDERFAWFGGDAGYMQAYHSYVRESVLETVSVPFTGGTTSTLKIELQAREALLLDNSNYPMGVVDWHASTDGGATWTALALDVSTAYETQKYKDYLFKGSVPCDGCGSVKLRAVLKTQNSPSTGLENDDFTPILEKLKFVDVKKSDGTLIGRLLGWDLVNGESTITQDGETRYEGDVVVGASTTAVQDPKVGAAGAVVLSRMDKLWHFDVGTTGGNAPGLVTPLIDASRDWTGDGLSDVLVAGEQAPGGGFDGGLDLVLLDGRRGTVVARLQAKLPADPDFPTAMTVADIEGDGDPDVVVGTENGGAAPYVEVLTRSGGTFARLSSQAAGPNNPLVDMIIHDLAASGDSNEDGWKDVMFGNEAGDVALFDMKPTTTTIWSTQPAELQGKVTFSFPVDMKSLYGTYFVVSSLEFDISEGDEQVTHTQVSRQVSYFHVKPPGGEVPRPPFYDLEIVAWVPEV